MAPGSRGPRPGRLCRWTLGCWDLLGFRNLPLRFFGGDGEAPVFQTDSVQRRFPDQPLYPGDGDLGGHLASHRQRQTLKQFDVADLRVAPEETGSRGDDGRGYGVASGKQHGSVPDSDPDTLHLWRHSTGGAGTPDHSRLWLDYDIRPNELKCPPGQATFRTFLLPEGGLTFPA